jgi:hypothetical protein
MKPASGKIGSAHPSAESDVVVVRLPEAESSSPDEDKLARARRLLLDMTEEGWLASSDPVRMALFLRERAATLGLGGLSCACCRVRCRRRGGLCPAYRKLRLFSCACCSRVLHRLPEPVCREALRAVEDYIEGLTAEAAWVQAGEEFDRVRRRRYPTQGRPPDEDAWGALYSTVHRRWEERYDELQEEEEQLHLVRYRWLSAAVAAKRAMAAAGGDQAWAPGHLLRDCFGNPHRPVALDPAWPTPDALALARAAYEGRELPRGTLDPATLSVLSDALEEAGCRDGQVLDHLRGPGPHVRGCWVVDLLLGKT